MTHVVRSGEEATPHSAPYPRFFTGFDYLIVYSAPYYKALSRLGTTDFSDTSCDAVVDGAIGSRPNRSAAVLFDRSVGVCPDDRFSFSQPVVVGQSTILKGWGGMMKDQIPGPHQTITYPPMTYQAQTILDFSASDTDGIVSATGASYRCHQWHVEDILIVGGYYYGANRRAGVHARKNVGGPSTGRNGLVKLIRVHVQGFYTGIDFDGLSSDGGGDSCKAYDCHVHDAVLGYVGGYSDSRFVDCDAWQMQDAGYSGEVPAGFVLTDTRGRISGCEIEPQLTTADGVRVVIGPSGVTPSLCSIDHNTFGFQGVGSQRNGCVVVNGRAIGIDHNKIAGTTLNKTIWLQSGAYECVVDGNSLPAAPVDDSGGTHGHGIANNVVWTSL